MAQSTVLPNKFRIQGDVVFFTKDISETSKEEQTIYEYEEIPIQLTPRDNMENYLENNYEVLFNYACEKIQMDALIPTEEEVQKAEFEIKVLTLISEVM